MVNRYSGDKSIAKLVILDKYINGYMNIMKENWSSDLWYVDTHAGTGVTELSDYRLNIEGSPIRALDFDFDAYYLYELNHDHWKSLCDSIEEKCNISLEYRETKEGDKYAIKESDPRILVFNMDSNSGVEWLIRHGNPSKHWFTFVDPEGLSVRWDLLRKLIDRGNTDILYNFQTEAFVRNSSEKAEHAHETLEEALGEDVPKGKSMDYYVQWFKNEKIEPIGYHTASRRMTSRGSSEWRYDLVFASGNETAVESLMNDIMTNRKTLRASVVEEIESTRDRATDPQEPFDSRLTFEKHGEDSEETQSGLHEWS